MRESFKFLSFGLVFFTVQLSGASSETIGAASKPSIELFVELNPMGSFIAKSEALTAVGVTAAKDKAFKAERIELQLSSLKTGIALRDEHMTKKYFESDKYPLAVMTNLSAENGKFKADLNIHNQTKSVEGTYTVSGKTATAEFSCALSDFKISPARYMGVGVEDSVKVKVKVDVPNETLTPAPAIVEKPIEVRNN